MIDFNRVKQVGECWIYQKSTNNKGYCVIFMKKQQLLVHRAAYCLFNGPLRPEQQVNHSCDNPRCINPLHLIKGTQSENIRDMYARGRDNRAKGERCARSKLTAQQVKEIRASDVDNLTLSIAYKVGRTTIRDIKRGNTWRHLLESRTNPTGSNFKGSKLL